MEPLRLFEAVPGSWPLVLSEGDVVAMFDVVEELGHTPNGYFWEGVAKTIVRQSAPDLEEVVDYDSEAGMFCAGAPDKEPKWSAARFESRETRSNYVTSTRSRALEPRRAFAWPSHRSPAFPPKVPAGSTANGGCATTAGPGRGPNDPNAASQPGSPGDVSNMNEVTKPSPGAAHGVTGDPPEGNPQLERNSAH